MTVWRKTSTGFGRSDGKGAIIALASGYIPRPTFSDGLRHSIKLRVELGAAQAAVLKYAGTDFIRLPASEITDDDPGRSAASPKKETTSMNDALEAKVDKLADTVSLLAATLLAQSQAAPAPTPEPEPAPAPAAPEPIWSDPACEVVPGCTWGAFKAAKYNIRARTYQYRGSPRKGAKLPRSIFVVQVNNLLESWGYTPVYS